MAGLYIHIPFCESRCVYCGFYSTTLLPLRDAYVEALCREMHLRPLSSVADSGEQIETIYLGGGTPSMLSPVHLHTIFEHIQAEYGAQLLEPLASVWESKAGLRKTGHKMEITMECNPDDVTEEFCKTLGTLPVNRISMGAQTFSDERLHFLRRRHKASDVRLAVERLREAGIDNISIDLMFGFPNETLEEWICDIDRALSLDVEHISAYSLMIEEGTPLHRALASGKIHETDEEVSKAMYETLIDRLTAAGYEQYEISNFARPGFHSRHNSSYWQGTPYLGIGAAAHSYERKKPETDHCTTPQEGKGTQNSPVRATRSWNIADIKTYIREIEAGRLPSEGETLNQETQFNDLITTAMRTREGVLLAGVSDSYGTDCLQQLLCNARPHLERGMMEIKNGHLCLTRKGLYVSDDIMSDLMRV